jgi:hypothetical protein
MRIASTSPSPALGVPDASPDWTARAAAIASIVSDLPWRRLVRRLGRSTSMTTKPSSRSQRASPAPQQPVTVDPDAVDDAERRRPLDKLFEAAGGCRHRDRAELAAQVIQRRGDVRVSVGVDPECDQHRDFWHGRHRRLLSLRGGQMATTGSVTADRTATGLAVKHLSGHVVPAGGPDFEVTPDRSTDPRQDTNGRPEGGSDQTWDHPRRILPEHRRKRPTTDSQPDGPQLAIADVRRKIRKETSRIPHGCRWLAQLPPLSAA